MLGGSISQGTGMRLRSQRQGRALRLVLKAMGVTAGPEPDLHSTRDLSAIRMGEELRLTSGPEPLAA